MFSCARPEEPAPAANEPMPARETLLFLALLAAAARTVAEYAEITGETGGVFQTARSA